MGGNVSQEPSSDKRFQNLASKYAVSSETVKAFHRSALLYKDKTSDKLSIIQSAILLNTALSKERACAPFQKDLSDLCSHVLKLANAKQQNADLCGVANDEMRKINEARKKVEDRFKRIQNSSLNLLDRINGKNDKKIHLEQTRKHEKEMTDLYSSVMKTLGEKSIEIMGEPLCEYSIVVLDSLEKKEGVRFSDFVHAILLQDGVQNNANYQEILDYFRWVSVIFHILVINLRETLISSITAYGIDDYSIAKSGWLFDTYSSCGIQCNGLPLQITILPDHNTSASKLTIELIKPISEMRKLLGTEDFANSKQHLAHALRKARFVLGSREVYHDFVKNVTRTPLNDARLKQKRNTYRNANQSSEELLLALREATEKLTIANRQRKHDEIAVTNANRQRNIAEEKAANWKRQKEEAECKAAIERERKHEAEEREINIKTLLEECERKFAAAEKRNKCLEETAVTMSKMAEEAQKNAFTENKAREKLEKRYFQNEQLQEVRKRSVATKISQEEEIRKAAESEKIAITERKKREKSEKKEADTKTERDKFEKQVTWISKQLKEAEKREHVLKELLEESERKAYKVREDFEKRVASKNKQLEEAKRRVSDVNRRRMVAEKEADLEKKLRGEAEKRECSANTSRENAEEKAVTANRHQKEAKDDVVREREKRKKAKDEAATEKRKRQEAEGRVTIMKRMLEEIEASSIKLRETTDYKIILANKGRQQAESKELKERELRKELENKLEISNKDKDKAQREVDKVDRKVKVLEEKLAYEKRKLGASGEILHKHEDDDKRFIALRRQAQAEEREAVGSRRRRKAEEREAAANKRIEELERELSHVMDRLKDAEMNAIAANKEREKAKKEESSMKKQLEEDQKNKNDLQTKNAQLETKSVTLLIKAEELCTKLMETVNIKDREMQSRTEIEKKLKDSERYTDEMESVIDFQSTHISEMSRCLTLSQAQPPPQQSDDRNMTRRIITQREAQIVDLQGELEHLRSSIEYLAARRIF